MKSRMWVTEKLEEVEAAQKEGIALMRDPELEHAHDLVAGTLANTVIVKAFLQSSLTMLDAKEK